MVGEWRSAPLSELCEQIADCPHSTPLWTNSGVIVLRNQNIRGGRLDLSSPSYTDEAHFEQRSRRARLKAGDLVLTREAPMGEVCIVPANLRCCLGQRMVMLRPDPKKCDSRFLLYSIQSDAVQHEIKVNEGTGSTVSNLRIPLLEALSIPHPPLAEQRAIAAVLGALDDKIELNRRMNATLESMARALFQSWFVDFDPVRAKLDPPQADQ
ncbi:MAG: restriction endonuclease subunit S, partial [Planctomyces sp.]